jgi:O-antigen/teichoic acid export membrane protein
MGVDRSSLSKSTVSGAFYTIGRSLAILLSGSILFVVIAKFFPNVKDLGLAHALVSLTVIASLVAGLGLPNAAMRFMSYYYGAGRDEVAKRLRLFTFLTGIVSSLCVSVALFYFSSDISQLLLHSAKLDYLIQLVALDVFFVSIIAFGYYILYSEYRFKFVASISIINSALRFAIPIVFMFFGIGIASIIIGFIVSDAICTIILSVVLVPKFGKKIPSVKDINLLFHYSFPLYGSYIMGFLSVNLDYYLLLYLSNLFAVGIYSPAVLVATSLIVILTAMGDVMLTYSSRIYGRSGIESLGKVSNFASRYVFLIFLPLGFMIVANTQPLILFFFGNKYIDSTFPAMILASSVTLTALGSIFNNILMAAGKSRAVLIGTCLGIPSQLVVSGITIPYFGAIGASIARSLTFAINFVYSSYRLKKLNALDFDKSALLFGIVGSSLMAIIVCMLNQYILGTRLIVVNVALATISYIVFLKYVRALNKQDINVMMNFCPASTRKVLLIIIKVLNR